MRFTINHFPVFFHTQHTKYIFFVEKLLSMKAKIFTPSITIDVPSFSALSRHLNVGPTRGLLCSLSKSYGSIKFLSLHKNIHVTPVMIL